MRFLSLGFLNICKSADHPGQIVHPVYCQGSPLSQWKADTPTPLSIRRLNCSYLLLAEFFLRLFRGWEWKSCQNVWVVLSNVKFVLVLFWGFFDTILFPQNKSFKSWLAMIIRQQLSISSYDTWTCIFLDLQNPGGEIRLKKEQWTYYFKEIESCSFFQGSAPVN